jgi:type III pantothenate kinase
VKLAIDIGNTKVKLALFSEDKIITELSVSHKIIQEQISILCKKHPIKHGIVSSVTDLNPENLGFNKTEISILNLDNKTKIPFANNCGTATKLGTDRIALIAGAKFLYPSTNVLVIDAGTCITYDYLTASGEYLGGAIAPGIEMRYKALNHFTSKLPLIEKEKPTNLLGKNTKDCMHIGIFDAMIFEIDGFIKSYKEQYGAITVILSGGDATFLCISLKSKIFVKPNLAMTGLNNILEYHLNV